MVTGIKIREIFSKRLNKAIADSSDWSQRKLSSHLKVSTNTVNIWATGKSWPEPEMIDTLSEILNVSPQWLMGANEISINEAVKLKIRNAIEEIENSAALEAAFKALQIESDGKLSKLNFVLDSMLDDQAEKSLSGNSKKEA